MSVIDIHADDYALSANNSQTMIELIQANRLNSISIICIMDCFEECMLMLRDAWESFDSKPLISIHIDLVDGVPITDEYLPHSWGSLLIASFLPGKRGILRGVLAEEIAAQICRVTEYLPEGLPVRIDSHMHTHMIPVVADAMWDAVDKLDIEVEFVRVAREPIMPFLQEIKLWKTYSAINFLKNIILNVLSLRLEKQCNTRDVKYGLLWGLIMSGHMDYDRISSLKSKVCKYALCRDKDVEILFHPGRVLEEERLKSHNVEAINEFYCSKNRDVELKAVRNMDWTYAN